jgi:naphthalene 1,2-dioxygenase system ferredoxin subunit
MSDSWLDVASRTSLPNDDVVAVQADGREIALYTVNGEVFATDNICTHGHARLCDGFLEGTEIECPLHQGRFDVRTGKAMCSPLTTDIRSFPVRIVEDRVHVLLD